ncbi:neutral/alkaline non-lysosomal ceramidase N-terminal domain-containing protein [Candidatus Latescibacterota bacterium]
MFAGVSKVEITPHTAVWMDGMIRTHKSTGVHDPIYTRALVLATDKSLTDACAIVSVEVCGISGPDAARIHKRITDSTGIPAKNIIIAATHTHSGPAALGFFNPKETGFVEDVIEKTTSAVKIAVQSLQQVLVGYASGIENTISHYRRLLAHDGNVVMNWEPYPPEKISCPLGDIDPEVGVLVLIDTNDGKSIRGLIFNHAGHPNVMSGDNHLISGDYPGLAMSLIEEDTGGVSLFFNGAQGTMDIDGLKDRDWEGVNRTGSALRDAVMEAAGKTEPGNNFTMRVDTVHYCLRRRVISDDELSWAEKILADGGDLLQAMADGVGDDYKAGLYKDLHSRQDSEIDVSQTCIVLGDCAFLSFPGELFTEIGVKIKKSSPFPHTYIIGLANGEIGYVPTKQAVVEGGYAVETREVYYDAEDIVLSKSLALLNRVYEME